jgi:hypothetical protein
MIVFLLAAILICMPFFQRVVQFAFGVFCLIVTVHRLFG